MKKLSPDQLLYLLYVFSYSYFEENSVTKGTIKELLSRDKKELSKEMVKEDADRLCESLFDMGLIKFPKDGRLSVTDEGIQFLVFNLGITEYNFNSLKGPKVLNALKYCIKIAFSTPYKSSDDMDFETFLNKFRELYSIERKRQELNGVVAIYRKEICQKFIDNNSFSISKEKVNEYFNKLKLIGTIFTSVGQNDELVHWIE